MIRKELLRALTARSALAVIIPVGALGHVLLPVEVWGFDDGHTNGWMNFGKRFTERCL